MQLEPGMRVRCVDADGHSGITQGREYRIRNIAIAREAPVVQVTLGGSYYLASRFKPIVRVKALTS